MIIAIIAIAWFTFSTLLVVAICINKSRVEDAQEEYVSRETFEYRTSAAQERDIHLAEGRRE